VKARKPGASSGHGRKCSHLVFGLKEIQLSKRSKSSVGVGLKEELLAHANGKNGDVGIPNPFHNLIEIHLAERVSPGSQHQHSLLAFDVLDAVQNIPECIEDIRFAEWRKHKLVKSLHDLVAVVSEVDVDVGTHIERLQRDPIIRLEIP